MSRLKVYDEHILCDVKRKGKKVSVWFYDIKTGDMVWLPKSRMYVTATTDAHRSGDASYDGWLFYANHDSFFPEDFVKAGHNQTYTIEITREQRTAYTCEASSLDDAFDKAEHAMENGEFLESDWYTYDDGITMYDATDYYDRKETSYAKPR